MANIGVPVKLPPDFDLQSQNAAAEWKFWRTTFEDYMLVTGQNESPDEVKLSVLRNIIGTESARVMSTFNIPAEGSEKYKLSLQAIENYVNPRVNESFERYTFLKRVQKEGESLEHFLTECRHLIRTCNYSATDSNQSNENKALRDKIVIGIRGPITREALLRIDDLTLDKAINFCRTSEQSKSQSLAFQESSQEVNAVRKKKSMGKPKFQSRPQQQFAGEKFKCRRCQTTHGPRMCPAFGKKCKKCGIDNHFAVACRVKNIRNVERNKATSEEEIFVGNVNNRFKKACDKSIWEENLFIENRKVKVRFDTGADVNIIPLKIFKFINKQFKVRPVQYMLKAF
nr:unnamed protein product [Callosobruchus chinensis]